MEQTLFAWGGWDMIDTNCFMFYDIVMKDAELISRAGSFLAKDALVDYSDGTLRLYDAAGAELEFKLRLRFI